MMKLIYFLLLFLITSHVYVAQCTATPNDCDGDGVLNAADLDDDNDGILDTAENTCILPPNAGINQNPHLFWDVNNTAFPGALEGNNLSPDVITSSSGVTFGPGLPGSSKNVLKWQINNVNSTTISEAKANNDYIQFIIAMNSLGNTIYDLKEWVTYGNSFVTNLQNLSIEIADNDCRDTDGDLVPDINDVDDDNDGITDADECGPALNSFETAGSFGQTSTYRDFIIAPNPPLTGYSFANDGTILDAGEYVITSANNSNNIHNQHWKNLYGHTTGGSTDAYLAVNGSTAVATFYKQDLVPLQVNTLYRVSLWAINAITLTIPYNDSPANLRVKVYRNSDNVIVADYSTGDMYARVAPAGTSIRPIHWREAAGTFNSGNATSFRIEVSNINTSSSDNDFAIDDITIRQAVCADTDNDGVPNSLDLDSDNDTCPDAIEGSANIIYPNLKPDTSIAGAVTESGIPTIIASGQTIGDSSNSSINACVCYKPVVTAGTLLDTKHGITSLNRAGAANGNWPMVRKGAWTALESRSKGFVPNRLSATQIAAIPSIDLREGMMVYNISADCLQINTNGTATGWKCLSNVQSCPHVN